MRPQRLAWLNVGVLGLLLAACGGAQTAQEPQPAEVQGEPAPAVGIFADETIRDLLALAPDGAEAVKILHMPPDFMEFLEPFLQSIDPDEGFGGATLLDWLLPLLPGLASPGPAIHAVLWVRQPHVGLAVTPLEASDQIDHVLVQAIMSTPEVDREEVDRLGQTWARLTLSERSPATRSPMETLVRWHDDRFLLLLAPHPDAPGRESRVAALAERLDPSAFGERWTESILESLSALDTAVEEAIRTREDAEHAVRRWAAGTPGGRLESTLARELQTLLDFDLPDMDPLSSVGAVLPDAARFVALLRAHQSADNVFRDTLDLSTAVGHLVERASRALRCHAREEQGRTWLAYRYSDRGLPAQVRIARDPEHDPEHPLVSVLDYNRPELYGAPVALVGSTSSVLRQESADLWCQALLGDPRGFVHTRHALSDRFGTFPALGAPERELAGPGTAPRRLTALLIDRIMQNGTLEVDADSGELVIQFLAPSPLQDHLDAHAAGIPGIEVAQGSAEASGALRYHSMMLTWQPFDEAPGGMDREGPLHLWTLQFAAPGNNPRESLSEPAPQWMHDAVRSSFYMGSLLHPAELVDALTLPLIESGLTSHLVWTAAPVIDALLQYRPGSMAVMQTSVDEGVHGAFELVGFRHIEGPGEQASEWGEILARDNPHILTDPAILGHLLLVALPTRLLQPEGAPEGLRFLRTNHFGSNSLDGWHALHIHARDDGAFELTLDNHEPILCAADDARTAQRWTLGVGRPVSIENLGRPLLMALHTADGTPIGSPFALASTLRIPSVQGSVLDLVFGDLGGGAYGAHLRAEEPMELHLVCVEGCDHPLTLELVFE